MGYGMKAASLSRRDAVEMASPLERKLALMHRIFPLMLTINMNGLGAAVIIV